MRFLVTIFTMLLSVFFLHNYSRLFLEKLRRGKEVQDSLGPLEVRDLNLKDGEVKATVRP